MITPSVPLVTPVLTASHIRERRDFRSKQQEAK